MLALAVLCAAIGAGPSHATAGAPLAPVIIRCRAQAPLGSSPDRLRAVAAAVQPAVLDVLHREVAAGQAADIRPLWIANVIGARLSPAACAAIAGLPEVESVRPDRAPDVREPALGGIAGVTCGVELTRAPGCWAEGITGTGVVIAVIDTGCCLTHPDLAARIWTNAGEVPGNGVDDDGNGYADDVHGWNFQSHTSDVSDADGHGTHTAGTIAGDGASGIQTGMAPGARLMILKVPVSVDAEAAVWEAMQYAVANGAGAMSIHLGWSHSLGPDRAVWRQVAENCMAAGVCVAAIAGGNGACCGVDSIMTPGDVPGVVTVGAVSCQDAVAAFSGRGPVTWQDVPPYFDWPYPPGKLKPTITAPGVNTVSTSFTCSGYSTYSGTSMSAAHGAGAIALVLQANPALSPVQVTAVLEESATDLGAAGPDNTYGAGRLDALAAVELARSLACAADINGDGVLDIDDFIAFQTLFGLGDARADCDRSGTLDIDDFICFQTLFGRGCP